jgi:hypothetical protein
MNAYDTNSIYQGTIIRQEMTTTREGDPQLRLGVEVTHKMKSKLEVDGVDPLPEELRGIKTIYFSFKPNPDQVTRNFRDLKNLGLNSPDIDLLNPSNPKALKLEGKAVCLKPRYSADPKGGPDKDWWNLVFPMSRAPAISSDAIKSFKEANKSVLEESFKMASEPRPDRVNC